MCIIDRKKTDNSTLCLTLTRKVLWLFLFIFLNTVISKQLLAETAATYGPVKTGDKLWDIAEKVRPDATVGRHQMIIALLKTNPQAFRTPCNIQSLQIGYTLTIPTLTVIHAVSDKEAATLLSQFNREKSANCPFTEAPPPSTAIAPAAPVLKKPSDVSKSTQNDSPASVPIMVIPSTIRDLIVPILQLPVVTDFLMVVGLFFGVLLSGWLLQKYTVARKISQESQPIATVLTSQSESPLSVPSEIPPPSDENSTQSSVVAKTSAAVSEKSQDNWQELVQISKDLPMQHYVPENKAKVFDLVDKVFELLDNELHAQGQLVEAYKTGPRQKFLTADDSVASQKPEKTLIEEPVANPPRKVRQERKPTRYL